MQKKLLFVCLGNICRSPAAENIMNLLIEQEGLSDRLICDSAGTGGWHVGALPDRRMRATAQARGMNFIGAARQFQAIDLREFDFSNGQRQLSQYPRPRSATQIYRQSEDDV